MRLLADENMPYLAIAALRGDDHDVLSVAELSPGAPDTDIFALAIQDDLIVLTFDKDFGDIARQATATARCGVILFRGITPSPTKSDGTLSMLSMPAPIGRAISLWSSPAAFAGGRSSSASLTPAR